MTTEPTKFEFENGERVKTPHQEIGVITMKGLNQSREKTYLVEVTPKVAGWHPERLLHPAIKNLREPYCEPQRPVNFEFEIDERVITDLGDEGIVTMTTISIDGSEKCLVEFASDAACWFTKGRLEHKLD